MLKLMNLPPPNIRGTVGYTGMLTTCRVASSSVRIGVQMDGWKRDNCRVVDNTCRFHRIALIHSVIRVIRYFDQLHNILFLKKLFVQYLNTF